LTVCLINEGAGDRSSARNPPCTPGSEPHGISEEDVRKVPPNVMAYMKALERQAGIQEGVASQADTSTARSVNNSGSSWPETAHSGHAENSMPTTDDET